MFPLKQKIIGGYKFMEPTTYSSHHLGVDYRANYVELLAPFSGTSETMTGTQGGKTIWFRPDGQNIVIRFMHLSEMKAGKFKEGEVIGKTGNSGELTTVPHLHLDISKGSVQISNFANFINPETFNWGVSTQGEYMKFDLFKDKPTGKVYYRMFDMLLQYIDHPDKIKTYFGDNPQIYEVGDIHEAGTPIEETCFRPPVADCSAIQKALDECGIARQKDQITIKETKAVVRDMGDQILELQDENKTLADENEKIPNLILDTEDLGGTLETTEIELVSTPVVEDATKTIIQRFIALIKSLIKG